MWLFENKKRGFLTVCALIAVGLMALTATGRDGGIISNALGVVVVPTQRALTNSSQFVANFFTYIGDINRLIAENERLSVEVEGMLLELSRLSRLEADNLELTALLEMSQRYPQFEHIGAAIISRSNNNWHTSFTVDRGRNHGVAQNMVVTAHGGLVGRVVTTTDRSAHITPIIDDNSTVGAISSRGAFGFIRGDLTLGRQGLVRFELEAGSDIIEGDEVLTSSYGTIYPPGIAIGTIIEIIQSTPAGVVALVEPVADFQNLNNVLIIMSDHSE